MYRKVELKLCIIDNIIEILEKKHLKQSDLCAYIGINTSTMTTWKSRKTDPPAKYIILICEFLNISPYVLLTGKEKSSSTDNLSENEQEMLNIFSKFNPIEQAKLIGKLEGLYRYKQIKESKQLEKSDTANININTKNINKTENSNDQEARIASRSINNDIPERSVVDDYSEVFDAPDATDKYK